MDERYKISTPKDAANLVMMDMAYLDTEQIRVLLLDGWGHLVEKVSLYQGPPTALCFAPPRSSVPPSSATARFSSSATITPAATRHLNRRIAVNYSAGSLASCRRVPLFLSFPSQFRLTQDARKRG
jgi:hypothetical protein